MKRIINYFVSSWQELKKVSWPTTKEVVNHTVTVIVSTAIAIVVADGIDMGLSYIIQWVLESR